MIEPSPELIPDEYNLDDNGGSVYIFSTHEALHKRNEAKEYMKAFTSCKSVHEKNLHITDITTLEEVKEGLFDSK